MPSASPSQISNSSVDIFLHVQTKRAGKIKGEAANPGHVDDIVVVGWNWGMRAHSALGATGAHERRSYTSLTVRKQIDRATTGLMSALVTNDEVKEAKLSLRRAGGSQEEFFIITLNGARVDAVEHSTDEQGHPQETISLAFTKVEVEYRPQLATGLRGGATVFTDEIHSA